MEKYYFGGFGKCSNRHNGHHGKCGKCVLSTCSILGELASTLVFYFTLEVTIYATLTNEMYMYFVCF